MKKTMGAADFKARCLELLDQVGPEGLTITKHGKPVARLLPIATQNVELIGSLKEKITIRGNILSTGLDWDAQS